MIESVDSRRFWSVVASSGPELSIARFAMALNSLGPNDLRAFCMRLDQIDDELDTQAHREQSASAFELARTDVTRSWPTPETQCPAEFDQVRATVMAHGQDAWHAVAAGPTLLCGGWPTGLGRTFLLAIAEAWRQAFPEPQPT